MDLLTHRAVKRLKRTALRRPEVALRLAAQLGIALGPGSRWAPTAAEIEAVLGVRDPRRIRAIQRRIAANGLRDVTLGALVNRRGLATITDRVQVLHEERLLETRAERAPTVLVFGHFGAGRGVSAALECLGIPSRIASMRRLPGAEGHVEVVRVNDPASAARFLRRSLARLPQGVVPGLAFDCHGTLEASFLGRRLSVARGMALLASQSALLLPVTSRWLGNTASIETEFHPAFPQPESPPHAADERAWVAGIAGWFEDYIRRHPGELRLRRLQQLAKAPRVKAS
jgi:lauroyl/myristoyl acyltransferase